MTLSSWEALGKDGIVFPLWHLSRCWAEEPILVQSAGHQCILWEYLTGAVHGPFWPCFCSNITTRSKTAQVGEIQRTADLRQLWPVAKKVQLVYMKDHESTCEELGIEWNDIIVLVHHWFLALQLFLRSRTCFSSYFNIFAGDCFAEENLSNLTLSFFGQDDWCQQKRGPQKYFGETDYPLVVICSLFAFALEMTRGPFILKLENAPEPVNPLGLLCQCQPGTTAIHDLWWWFRGAGCSARVVPVVELCWAPPI